MALATPTAVVLELMTMGQKSAAHLGDLLRAASPQPPGSGEHQHLAEEILRCCDRVIAELGRGGAGAVKKRKAAAEQGLLLPAVTPSKRRARGAEALREVTSSTTADGFIWRKYGQKDINGCKNPRLYYRCAYRDQGCMATRRLQRSQEGPAAYTIAYYGEHTCRDSAVLRDAASPPAVVDFGSSDHWGCAGGADQNRGASPLLPVPSTTEQKYYWDGGESRSETSKGWSSPSSSEIEQEVPELGVAGADEPWYASQLGSGFLDDGFDWGSIIDCLDSDGLHHIPTFQ